MLKFLRMVLGYMSYGAAFLIMVVDFVFYYTVHIPLKLIADQFTSDGDSLTGWQVRGDVKTDG